MGPRGWGMEMTGDDLQALQMEMTGDDLQALQPEGLVEELHLTGECDDEEDVHTYPRERGIELGISLLYSPTALRKMSEEQFLASIDRFHMGHRRGALDRFRHLKEKNHGKPITTTPDPPGPGDRLDETGPDAAGEPLEPLPGSF